MAFSNNIEVTNSRLVTDALLQTNGIEVVNSLLPTASAAPTQATPTFSPVAGSYSGSQTVTIVSAGADSIYYTIDGSAPDKSKTLYTGPITVAASETVKAIAYKANSFNSAVGSAAYVISTILTQDTFVGAGGTALSAHLDNNGNSWATWSYDTASPAIISINGSGFAINDYTSINYNAASLDSFVPPSADYTVQCTFTVLNATFSCQVFARTSSGAATGYYFIAGSNVTPALAIGKLLAGVNSWLSTAAYSWTPGDTHTLSLSVKTVGGNATFTASIDGVPVMTATDSASPITAAGQAGFGIYALSQTEAANFQVLA